MLGEGFDVIFSLITEYHKSATVDMKQQGICFYLFGSFDTNMHLI